MAKTAASSSPVSQSPSRYPDVTLSFNGRAQAPVRALRTGDDLLKLEDEEDGDGKMMDDLLSQ